MHRTVFALALIAQGMPAAAQPVSPSSPTSAVADHAADLRCAATIAIAAAEQARGNPAISALPPLGNRGRRYFAFVGNRLVAEGGQSREQVRDALSAEASGQRAKFGPANGPAFSAALGAAVSRCQPRLDAAIAPLIVPDLAQCAALAALGAADARAEEGEGADVQSLDALAFTLAGMERQALVHAGKSAAEAEAALTATRASLARAVQDSGLDVYDFDRCVALTQVETQPSSAIPAAKSPH